MPLVVDREKEKIKILMAFEKCISEKPLFNITLRDIASKAGMTHPKLLNYFPCKDDIVLAYCKYAKDYMSQHCIAWFSDHNPKDYKNNMAYINKFLEYVANGSPNESRPIATIQTYVLAKYNNNISLMVKEEFDSWRIVMKNCLNSVYGSAITESEAEYMMIIITGLFVCNYNHALTGNINQDILGAGKGLLTD